MSELQNRRYSAAYFFGFIYLAYRYPFQINNSLTSQAYSDTPLILSLGKYLLAGAYFTFIFILWLTKYPRMEFKTGFYFLILLSVYGFVLSFYNVAFFKNDYLLECVFFSVSALAVIASNPGSRDANYFLKIIPLFAWLYLFVDVFQVFLFFAFGRLPALAWSGSISVRFGSVLDDPNGYSILLSLFIFLYSVFRSNFARVFYIALLFFSLLATQSITGIFAVLISTLSVMLFRGVIKGERPYFIKTILVVVLLSLTVLVFFRIFGDFVLNFMSEKQGSIEGHAKSLDPLYSITPQNIFVTEPWGQAGEIGYLNILLNSSGLYLLFYFSLCVCCVLMSFKRLLTAETKTEKIFFSCITTYMLSFFIANTNLPLVSVFPVNFFYWIFVGILFGYRKDG